jgi:hypothetical protein
MLIHQCFALFCFPLEVSLLCSTQKKVKLEKENSNMMVHILIQTLRRKNRLTGYKRPETPKPEPKSNNELEQEGLYYENVAGLFIFLIVTFVLLMIAIYN